MDVDDEASRILSEVFGYPQFRGEQREIIAHLIARRRCAGADAHRRRQVALLSDPGAGARRAWAWSSRRSSR